MANLYVANCGAAVGLSIDAISSVFSTFGEVNGVYAADESGTRVIVSYINENAARASLKTRNVNTTQHTGELPSFVFSILGRIALISDLDDDANIVLDQLTVNEYPSGVGLSPHIDTHSAFEGLIFSLSLAGPCIMEFRRHSEGVCLPKPNSDTDSKAESPDSSSNFTRRAIYLPLDHFWEARYAWHHYIPHHKVDLAKDSVIRRGSRRVSFTFRKVR
ncbi:alkylated DNA repair protein ALKBH8 homolog [Actinidia eriantha]|uniref:alkylated DNA repair protein ALKBH8 homolog n=1 Tax=Actinidia eriantha TaxID=165200 RepID=UPI00258C03DB|nr:alkylated DNA repair protein ALKBH8 homolog [Actinidia eriantha]